MNEMLLYLLFGVWVVCFSFYFYRASQKYDYIILFAGIVPVLMILTYGLGSLLLQTFEPEERYVIFQCNFNDWDLIFVLINAILASVLYFISFILSFKGTFGKRTTLNSYNQVSIEKLKVGKVVFVLVAFDLTVRLLALGSGTYFSWVGAHVKGLPWMQTSLFQIQSALVPLLGVFLYVHSKVKKWARAYLIIFGVLILLEGDRSDLIMFILSVVFAYLYFNQKQIKLDIVVKGLIAFIIFFGLLGPVIQEVRYEVRDDIDILLDDPIQLPFLLVTEHIPSSLTFRRIFGEERRRTEKKVTLCDRLIRWPAFWASVNSRILDGHSFRCVSNMSDSLALVIPLKLYIGNKPIITSGKDNLSWYGLYAKGDDPNTSFFFDAFSIGGILGMAVFSVLYGVTFGFFTRFLISRLGVFGIMIFFGLINNFIIFRDSFAMAFVNLRDSILICLAIVVLYKLSKIRFHSISLVANKLRNDQTGMMSEN